MGWIRNAISKRKEKWHNNAVKNAKSRAITLFQVKEYNSLLWLTFDGFLIVPFSMLCKGDDASEYITLLNAIRDIYAKMITDGNER